MGSVGYRTGLELDRDRLDWDGAAGRPLAWSAWYPMSTERGVGHHPRGQFFDLGDVEFEGHLAEEPVFPVVLLSHGTGGSPESLGYLARQIAQRGYVVIGAHHHGNTGREPYRAEGFLCWWERAADLSVLLTMLSGEGFFSGRLDLDRAHAVGFSLGGYAVLALAGARTSMKAYLNWASEADAPQAGPREFPDVAGRIPRLLETSETFRRSWDRHGESFRDTRIRTVTAIAPPPPVRAFDAGSLRSISIPVMLITGEADTEAPSRDCADWLTAVNPKFKRNSVGADVGHYTFVGFPARRPSEDEATLFKDKSGVDRARVHDAVSAAVLSAIGNS